MRRVYLSVVVLVISCSVASSATKMYSKGVNVGQIGIGIGGLGGFYGSSSLPTITAGLDFGIHKDVSVGGLIGYTASTYESNYFVLNTPSAYKLKYTYIVIAGRGSYHLPLDVENTDFYGGLDLGYTIVSSKFEGTNTIQAGFVGASGSYMFFGIHAGGRYYFSPKFSAFAELGYGFGILNIGIAMKF